VYTVKPNKTSGLNYIFVGPIYRTIQATAQSACQRWKSWKFCLVDISTTNVVYRKWRI